MAVCRGAPGQRGVEGSIGHLAEPVVMAAEAGSVPRSPLSAGLNQDTTRHVVGIAVLRLPETAASQIGRDSPQPSDRGVLNLTCVASGPPPGSRCVRESLSLGPNFQSITTTYWLFRGPMGRRRWSERFRTAETLVSWPRPVRSTSAEPIGRPVTTSNAALARPDTDRNHGNNRTATMHERLWTLTSPCYMAAQDPMREEKCENG